MPLSWSRDGSKPHLRSAIIHVVLSWAVFPSCYVDFGERGLRVSRFYRRGTFQPNSQQKTFTADLYHPLRACVVTGFTAGVAASCSAAKLLSTIARYHISRPSPSSAPSRARHASSQTPCSSHCFRRRQQVDGEGNSSGRKRHGAPVCRTQRIPSKHARLDAHGLPRLSLRVAGAGSNGSTNFHSSLVINRRRFFMTEVHQPTRVARKYSIRGRTYL